MTNNAKIKLFYFLETILEWAEMTNYRRIPLISIALHIPFDKFTEKGILKSEITSLAIANRKNGIIIKFFEPRDNVREIYGSLETAEAQKRLKEIYNKLNIIPDIDKIRQQYHMLKNDIGHKDTVYIDAKKGIYINFYLKDQTYEIKRNSKKYSVLEQLNKEDVVTGQNLLDISGYSNFSTLSKAIKSINKLFINKTQAEFNLITSIPTRGYSLNKTDYSIKFT